MKKLFAALLLSGLVGTALAQGNPGEVEKRELIYCADLMTHAERDAYRAKMQSTRSLEEKAKIRADHRVEMQARAARQGVAGQCEPRQVEGTGMGQRQGQGQGQGQGRGGQQR